MTKCKSCGANIFWAKTEKGKNMPIDAQKSLCGNIQIGEDGVAVVTGAGPYTSHFQTCPQKKQWRKKDV